MPFVKLWLMHSVLYDIRLPGLNVTLGGVVAAFFVLKNGLEGGTS